MYRRALFNLVATLNTQTCVVQVRGLGLNVMANKTGKQSSSSGAQEAAGRIKRVSIEGNIGK